MSLPTAARSAIEGAILRAEDELGSAEVRTRGALGAKQQVEKVLERKQVELDNATAYEQRIRAELDELRSALRS